MYDASAAAQVVLETTGHNSSYQDHEDIEPSKIVLVILISCSVPTRFQSMIEHHHRQLAAFRFLLVVRLPLSHSKKSSECDAVLRTIQRGVPVGCEQFHLYVNGSATKEVFPLLNSVETITIKFFCGSCCASVGTKQMHSPEKRNTRRIYAL